MIGYVENIQIIFISIDEEQIELFIFIKGVDKKKKKKPLVLQRQKDKLPTLRDTPKKKLLKETAKNHTITKTTESFYPGAAIATNRLGIKINKAAEKKEQMWRRLQNKIKQLR